MRRAWILAAAMACTWGLASGAQAQLTVGGHLGYGAGLNAKPDPYRGLVGARSGWNFDNFYLGGHVSFFTGEKAGRSTMRQLQVLGVDAGYDIDLDKLYLRPVFGVGGAIALRDLAGDSRNEGGAFINFGAEALSKLLFGEKVFLGGGFRITSTFFNPDNINAFSFYLVAGTRFDFSGEGPGIPMGPARAGAATETRAPAADKGKPAESAGDASEEDALPEP